MNSLGKGDFSVFFTNDCCWIQVLRQHRHSLELNVGTCIIIVIIIIIIIIVIIIIIIITTIVVVFIIIIIISVFWDVTPCSWVGRYNFSEEPEVSGFSETLIQVRTRTPEFGSGS